MTRIFARTLFAISIFVTFGAPVVEGAPNFSTVVIDAGHGGFDPGGISGQRVQEKGMNLDVAQRLRTNLRRSGFRTVMTRDSDVFVPLPTRVAIANAQRDAIFVCVHFNSASRSGANGIETYYYRGDSGSLAASIHANVAGGAPSENRGVRRRGYYVLRRTAIPSVLVECGFLTNPTEARLAQTSSYRQQLADEIARGIRGQSSPANSVVTRSARAAAVTAVAPETNSFFNEESSAPPPKVDRHGTRYLAVAAAAEAEVQPVSHARSHQSRHASHARAQKGHHHASATAHKAGKTLAKKSSSKKAGSKKKRR